MKNALKVLGILILAVVAIGVGGIVWINSGVREMTEATFSPVDLSTVGDGTHIGEFNKGRWSNKVSVRVQGGRIAAIGFEKPVLVKADGVEEQLAQKVIERQNIDVDVVSGASATSHAYLKSIEDALINGEE